MCMHSSVHFFLPSCTTCLFAHTCKYLRASREISFVLIVLPSWNKVFIIIIRLSFSNILSSILDTVLFTDSLELRFYLLVFLKDTLFHTGYWTVRWLCRITCYVLVFLKDTLFHTGYWTVHWLCGVTCYVPFYLFVFLKDTLFHTGYCTVRWLCGVTSEVGLELIILFTD